MPLNQSKVWPVVSARDLHGRVQLSYLWRFLVPGIGNAYDADIMMTAQQCTIPGIEIEHEEYVAGGQVFHYMKKARRGGAVSAQFIEIEGGLVDSFFRNWANLVDPYIPGLSGLVLSTARARTPMGRGDGVTGYSRTARVEMYNRDGSKGNVFLLNGLKFKGFGPYGFNYNSSGAMLVPVRMICDEVTRV